MKERGKSGQPSVDERYTQWKSLVPVLYDWLANHNLVWPSLSCRWGPQLEKATYKNRQRLYLSEQTDGSVPNTLVIANVEVVKPRVAAAEHISQFNEEARSPFVKKYKTIIHPGEVNRIRELPSQSNIIATHTDSPDVFIWDVDTQPNRHAVLGASDSRPDVVLTGHQENAEFALALCRVEPLVLSGGKDKSVVLWSIQDHISSLSDASAAKSPGSASSSGKQTTKTGDEKNLDAPKVGPRGVFQGHQDTVEDVQFSPNSPQEFCSVGDDTCLILWDARVGTSPAIKVEKAHNGDLHCVDWNRHDENLILTGSADSTVRLFDRRKLTSGAVGSPLHIFEGHKAAVLCVQWCPDKASVFGSAAEDSFLNVWDYEKVGKKPDNAGTKVPKSPPGLFFQHAGHRDKVVDFNWNSEDSWTIVSVSDDCESTGGGGTLQIWRMSDLMKPNYFSDLGYHKVADYRSKNDNKQPEHTQKRVLPPSIQQTMHKNAPKDHTDSNRRKNVAYEYETDDKRRVSPSSSLNDDVLIYKSAGAHRVLPPTLVNGKSVDNPMLVSTADTANFHGLGEQRLPEYDERAIYQEALQNLYQPKVEDDLPDGLLSVSLLKHQKIALAWMVQKENSAHCTGGILADDQGLGKTISMIALIQKERTQQSKFTSNNSHETKPEALLNLDDDDDGITKMGEGKQLGEDDHKREHASGNRKPPAGTLVVCPASILRQWARELDEKVTSNAKLSVLIYHGGTRTRDPSELAKYDVVLTTYSIVTNEVPKQSSAADDDAEQRNMDKYEISSEFSSNKRKQTNNAQSKGKKKKKGTKDSHFDYDSGPLARVRWYRVILDEAQSIKNHRTQVARACSGLRAKKRWCLSGTPIQNSIDDLYSYFRFLKYDPYSIYSSFCSKLKFPISKNAVDGYRKLQAVLKVILLRRTKGTLINGEPIVKLPPKSVLLKKVDFSQEERSFYLKLEADSRQQFKKFAAAGTVRQNYASILLMLLRLRQACDHPVLVKGYHSDNVGKESLAVARQLPKDMLSNLLHQLEGSLAICRVCNDPPEDALVTMCGHVFCYQCVSERLTGDENLCPAVGCKGTVATDSVFSRATLQSCISDQLDNFASSSGLTHTDESSIAQRGYVSSKIKSTLEILNSLCSPSYNVDGGCYMADVDGANPEIPAKAIVFSQWTGMLDLIEASLNQSLIQYRRLDGSMTLVSRDRSVRDFNTDPEVTVMLMSLKAGNLGLNMVAACHVILLDLWWNPSTEDQAIDRAHRIGQTRPVIVSRLTVKDTVEDRILALQEEKRKMISSAFGEDQPGGHATKLTVDDLRYLFQV